MLNNLGNSTYHALQLQFTRRFSQGFTNTTTWTWSKALGESDATAERPIAIRQPLDRKDQPRFRPHASDHQQRHLRTAVRTGPFSSWQRSGLGSAHRRQVAIRRHPELQLRSAVDHHFRYLRPSAPSARSRTSWDHFPKNMGKITKVSNGVVYFDGFTQIQDPGFASVSTLNGLSTAYSNKAIVDPSGNIVLVNPQPGEVGTLGYSTRQGPCEPSAST